MRLHIVSGWRLALVATAVVVGAISVAAVLALAVKFGREMAGYLETSTGLVVDRTATSETSPAAIVPPSQPDADKAETATPAVNEDAAELRPTTTVAVEPQQ